MAHAGISQNIEDFIVVTGSEGQFKKIKDAPKKIYISSFHVAYQLLYMDSDVAAGGRELGGGYRSDAKASLLMGITGIPEDDLQGAVDKIYETYVSRIKAAGFEIVSADEVQKTETMSGWEKAVGGQPQELGLPGYLSVSPTGFEYLWSDKPGPFYQTKLSTEMDGLIVANVTIILPAFEDGESAASKAAGKAIGGVAKVVAKANLRIGDNVWIKNNSLKGGFPMVSTCSFVYKKSLKYQAGAFYKPKKTVLIEDVFDPKKKYKATESASQDLWGSSRGAFTVFNVPDQTMSKTQVAECDPEKYINGTTQAVDM